jgi:hypothetical protein
MVYVKRQKKCPVKSLITAPINCLFYIGHTITQIFCETICTHGSMSACEDVFVKLLFEIFYMSKFV